MFQYACFILFYQISTRKKFIFTKVWLSDFSFTRNFIIVCFLRVVSRAPRALTSDIIRVPFIQDTINIIRRSHQTYFDFSAFIDGKKKHLCIKETNSPQLF